MWGHPAVSVSPAVSPLIRARGHCSPQTTAPDCLSEPQYTQTWGCWFCLQYYLISQENSVNKAWNSQIIVLFFKPMDRESRYSHGQSISACFIGLWIMTFLKKNLLSQKCKSNPKFFPLFWQEMGSHWEHRECLCCLRDVFEEPSQTPALIKDHRSH